MSLRRSGCSIIAEWLGLTTSEVEKQRFAITRLFTPVYRIGDTFWCSPGTSQRPPKGLEWMTVGSIGDRPVYSSRVITDLRLKQLDAAN